MKILVLAAYLSPFRGSEFSVAWNYILEMSKENELTILYGCAGSELGDNSDLQEWMESNSLPNVKFEFVKPNIFSRILNWPNKKGYFIYSYFPAYRIWHKTAYKRAKKLISNGESFDLIHYLGPIGYREQGYLWKINLPYMRGPMGGLLNTNKLLLNNTGTKERIHQFIRTLTGHISTKFNRTIREALNSTDMVITATTEDQNALKRMYNIDSIYMPENCLRKKPQLNYEKFNKYKHIRLITVGTLDGRKNNMLLLKALHRMKHITEIEVNIVGDGPLNGILREYVINNKLSNVVIFHGRIDRKSVESLFTTCHLNILTSIMEANTTVIWEAMEAGVPTLSLDHCGMHDTVTSTAGFPIKIDIEEHLIQNIADTLDMICENPNILIEKAQNVITEASKYLWQERRKKFNQLYLAAIENFNQNSYKSIK